MLPLLEGWVKKEEEKGAFQFIHTFHKVGQVFSGHP